MIDRIKKKALIFLCCGALLQIAAAIIPESAGSVGEYLSVIASGLMLVGAVRLIRTIRISRDPDAAEEYESFATDERLRFIVERARSLTMIISVTGELALSLIASLIFGNKLIGNTLSYVACAQCVIYTVAYRIMEKKY